MYTHPNYDDVITGAPYIPGKYTRFGDVTTLTNQSDDLFTIFGVGDEVLLRFDASAEPPVPAGFVREYIVTTYVGMCEMLGGGLMRARAHTHLLFLAAIHADLYSILCAPQHVSSNNFYKFQRNPFLTPMTVEPLPFFDMTAFPYDSAQEGYPTGEPYDSYRAQFNTRAQ
jgi:hypothetical protein